MKSFKEYIGEALGGTVKVTTRSGAPIIYTMEDIEAMIPLMKSGADDLPKWLYFESFDYKFVKKVLMDALKGKVKSINFKESSMIKGKIANFKIN